MTRGSGTVTGTGWLGSVAGFGTGTGPVGELRSLWGSTLKLFVESSSPVLVEAHVATSTLVPAVAWVGSGEMAGEALAILYRPSQPYHPVNFEGGLLRDMPTEPSGQIRPHPCHVGSRPGPRSSLRLVVVSLRSPPSSPPGGHGP